MAPARPDFAARTPGDRTVWPALLLPYFAVGVGWIALESGWAAIGLYHLGILTLAGSRLLPRLQSLLVGNSPKFTGTLVLLIPLAAVLFLRWLPLLLRSGLDPGAWLSRYGLEGGGLLALALVYGCLHPILEEAHYQRLRAVVPIRAHLSYAGYHGLVLSTCFRDWAVLATVASLVGVSVLFRVFEQGRGGPRLSLFVHACADLLVAGIALRWGGWL